MSMRALIVGVFVAIVVVLTGPSALAEEAATPHAVHNHHDNRHPYNRFRHHHRGPSPEFGTRSDNRDPYDRFRHHHRGPSPNVGR